MKNQKFKILTNDEQKKVIGGAVKSAKLTPTTRRGSIDIGTSLADWVRNLGLGKH
ncbi:hypothetical protein [Pediococcus stilesii]|uniref:hypothetical protein n=1 Tax=Pediococcus stilesii TaxID=331679 RepID=UPI001486A451|nr:hypothetical protein [Pediococcus stilesii]